MYLPGENERYSGQLKGGVLTGWRGRGSVATFRKPRLRRLLCRHVLHLHGRINRFHCNVCGFDHELLPTERRRTLPPRCLSCGGPIRPSVVWFGEPLPARVLDKAWGASERCDLFLVAGTSGLVYPAAHLPLVAQQHGAAVIDINPEVTPIAEQADIHLAGRSGAILPRLLEMMEQG